MLHVDRQSAVSIEAYLNSDNLHNVWYRAHAIMMLDEASLQALLSEIQISMEHFIYSNISSLFILQDAGWIMRKSLVKSSFS